MPRLPTPTCTRIHPGTFVPAPRLILVATLTLMASATWAQSPPAAAASAATAAALPAAKPAVAPAPAWKPVASVEGISEYRLPNGLQILLIPDASKPTTTVNVTYRVGSRHESYGETGMAHLLEHLLFKGSPRHPQVWAEFNKRGLGANGSTAFDRTNYFASFAANDDNLRWYLGWQADAMVNSFIARRDLDSEMTVVRNEMEMGENDPFRVLYQQTLSAMYRWHNYGKAPIGARSDVEGVDIGRLQAFYRLHYQPDTATLIVSGKFDPQQVLAWVRQSFGPIPAPKRTLPPQYTREPVQDGAKSVTVERVGGTPLLLAAYHAPAGTDPDYAAFEALTLILGDTPSGRLHKRLTEKGLAASVFGFGQDLRDPGFVMFGAELAPGQDADTARDALLQTVESLRDAPITEEELERAKGKWLKGWDLAFADPQKIGVALSEAVALGDWRYFFLLRDRVRGLKLADVQRVADAYLLPSNRTLGRYQPTAQPQRAPLPAELDPKATAALLRDYKGDAAAAQAEAFEATPANLDARTHRSKLVSGLQLGLLPKATRGQVVRATLVLRFGDVQSLAGKGDAPDMLAALLDKGTATLTRQQFEDKLDELQTEFRVDASPGELAVHVTSRRAQLPAAIALLGDMLRKPALPQPALDELRTQALASLAQQRKEPGSILDEALDRHGDPYPAGDVRHARSFDEREADLKAVTLEQVKDFHARFYGAEHAAFAAVGDFDEAEVTRAVEAAFGDWRSQAAYTRVPDPLVPRSPVQLAFETPDKQNATLMVRLPVPLSDRDADYPLLMLANHLLGGGGDSRLWNRVREKEGLSYSIYSGVRWNADEPNSLWMASAIFAPSNRAKVETAVREELQRALTQGFTEAELAAGKRSLLSYRQLGRANDGGIAAGIAHQLPRDRTFADSARVDAAIQSATLAQVNAALRRYIQPQQLLWGVAGDFKAAAK